MVLEVKVELTRTQPLVEEGVGAAPSVACRRCMHAATAPVFFLLLPSRPFLQSLVTVFRSELGDANANYTFMNLLHIYIYVCVVFSKCEQRSPFLLWR